MAKKVLPCGRPSPEPAPKPNKEKLEAFKQSLKKYLSEENLKFTEQRWAIVKMILESGGHLDAQEMVELVKKKNPKIGAATVYRNIKVLCDAGLLELTHQNIEGRDVYELTEDGQHDHIICLDCGQAFEFSNDEIQAIQKSVAKELSFELQDQRHIIHAKCTLLER